MERETNRKKILIVDDEESVLRIMKRIVERIQRECTLAYSAEEARRTMREESFDLILCDIRLPGESGMDFIKDVVSEYPDTAIIMVSGLDDAVTVEKALEMGAYGYIVKPFKISEVLINVSSALRRQKLESERRIYQESLEEMVAERTEKLRETLADVIHIVALTVETRDPYTAGHQRRAAELSCGIAKEMGLSEERIEGIRMAGLIHDLGKISVPAEILSKPSRLSKMEFELIKAHPQVGYDILKGIDFPWPVALITLQHHERMNGSGYPQGLKGEEILLEARILMVADVVEAISSHRPYRPGLGVDAALEEILKNRAVLYDPQVVNACVNLFSQKGFCFES